MSRSSIALIVANILAAIALGITLWWCWNAWELFTAIRDFVLNL